MRPRMRPSKKDEAKELGQSTAWAQTIRLSSTPRRSQNMPRQRHPLASLKIALVSALLVLSMGVLNSAFAQSSTVGTITGTVRDQNGAVVPKAEITLEEERTGLSRTVKTNE